MLFEFQYTHEYVTKQLRKKNRYRHVNEKKGKQIEKFKSFREFN